MRKVLKRILEILDGTPAVYGKKQRGQSVLELALVSPLLVILLAGMVEIGWFARNYLILLEVTRVGARTGTVQQNETSPVNWDNEGSILPSLDSNYPNTASYPDVPINPDDWIQKWRLCDISKPNVEIGFYNFIACVMQRSLNPLPFGRAQRIERGADPGDTFVDEMVVSAFSVQAVDPTYSIFGNGVTSTSLGSDVDWPLGYNDQVQAIVVGRWPENANECHYKEDDTPYDTADPGADGEDGRDPFDWIHDGGRTIHPANYGIPLADREDRMYLELEESDNIRERQRGFVWNGRHQIEGTGCFGSEWSVSQVEDLINLQQFNLDTAQRRYVPSQGIVLVEMWWKHETLSQFVGLSPVISPVFAILGTDTVIETWAAFPLPQVEPRIEFEQ
ncbi:MAG: pilus assembly protein [Anaerolineae bacterium]|nr:pilus assembly protein [Anaerolineae bacterium]